MGVARADNRPSRLLGRRDRAIIRLLCQLLIPLTPGLTKCPTAGPWRNIIVQKFSFRC